MKRALKLTSNSRVFYLNFLIGRSILVSDLYLSNSGFADCLPSARNADKEKQHSVCDGSKAKDKRARICAQNRKCNSPPHKYLTEIIRVTRVLPKSVSYKSTASVLAEFMHLHVCHALHNGIENREQNEERTCACRCDVKENAYAAGKTQPHTTSVGTICIPTKLIMG